MSATLNGLRVVSARLFTPETRVWFADLDLDPDDVAQAPTGGAAILTIDGATLVGTVDPRGSSTFVQTSSVRLVGGAGGWDKSVPAQDFVSQASLQSRDVYAATAKLVGETVNDSSPISFGKRYPRMMGPAATIFRQRDWYVDLSGVTQVASRPPAVADTSLELLSFDPLEQCGECSCDVLVLPGTVVTDSVRLPNGPITLRDVDQTWTTKGVRAKFWAAASHVSRARAAFSQLTREAVDLPHLRIYRYRFVMSVNGNAKVLALQAITPGAPDMNPIDQWTGLSGAFAELAPSTVICVGFTADDPPQAVLLGYESTPLPLQTTVDAQQIVNIGPTSALVQISGGGSLLVKAVPYNALLTGLKTFAGSLGGATDPAVTGAAAALVTLLETAPILENSTEKTSAA
jgi:hypothetical protein